MDKFEKLALEAIEESKTSTYTPQDPFASFGFNANPFLETTIEELQNEECIESRFRVVIKYINKVYNSFKENYSENKSNDNIIMDGVLYGSSQSGMSTLISLSHQYLVKVHKELTNAVYTDAYELVEFEDNQYSIAKTFQNFRNHIGGQSTEGDAIPLLIVDHADFLIEFFEDFRYSIDRDFQNTPIVFIFSQAGWTRLKNELAFSEYDLINHMVPSQKISSLNEDEIFEILSLKLSKDGQILNPFSHEILKAISKKSSGSLINAIKICSKVCDECFINGLDVASLSFVNDITSLLAIDVNKEFFDLVTLNDNTQTFVLSLIAMKSIAYDFGITYDDIVNNLGIQKNSASHHLKQLQEKRYLIKRTVNRKAFYRLRDELKTLADTYLMKSFEQKETLVRLESISDLI
ncbi:MAG: winged helix-turn-helix transcriptional regulator [Candidatus Heimdallarchaeota archaeon]|nr:winged helix-turn-helix transcriptional regulator [Candidatus Heimdallarchaeota archaeon]